MRIEKLLDYLTELGLGVRMGDGGEARLVVPGDWTDEDKQRVITKPLLDALRLHKAELLEKLCGVPRERQMECLFATGFVGKHWFPASDWPVGARAWRYVGETEWRPISGGEATDASA